MAVTELLNTMALVESSHHEVKAGYVLDYPQAGVLFVMSKLAPRYGKLASKLHAE